jgi:hypothetical protein
MSDITQSKRSLPVGPTVTIAGAALIAVGSLLPWASVSSAFGTVSFAGTEGDGRITLVLAALIGLGAALLWRRPGPAWILRVIVGLLAAYVVYIAWNDMSNLSEETAEESDLVLTSVGAGLYLVLIGGLAALGGLLIPPRDELTLPGHVTGPGA